MKKNNLNLNMTDLFDKQEGSLRDRLNRLTGGLTREQMVTLARVLGVLALLVSFVFAYLLLSRKF